MSVKKIVRITRHSASPEQLTELTRLYPEAEVGTVDESLPTESRAFTARFDELAEGAQVVEAVLPANLLEAALRFTNFAKNGGVIVRAVMNRAKDNDGNVVFIFDHYEKVIEVRIVTEAL